MQLSAMIRVRFSQVSECPSETMPRNHRNHSETMRNGFGTLYRFIKELMPILGRDRNHASHSTETTETMSIHMVSWFQQTWRKQNFLSRGGEKLWPRPLMRWRMNT